MNFTVIVMRPLWFVDCVNGFETTRDLQYVAMGVESNNVRNSRRDAGLAALQEAFDADYDATHSSTGFDLHGAKLEDYTVLGLIEQGGEYEPWLNGDRP